MASVPRGRQTLLRLYSSCRSSRCQLREGGFERRGSRVPLRNRSWPKSFFIESNAEQQNRGSSGYLNPVGLHHQVVRAAPICHAACFCSSCIRSTSALSISCNAVALPLVEARRDAFAKGFLSQEICSPAFGSSPAFSSSVSSCWLTLPSTLHSSGLSLGFSWCSRRPYRPATFCRSSPWGNVVSPVPPAAAPTDGVPNTCSPHEATRPRQKAWKHQRCSVLAVDGQHMDQKRVFGSGTDVLSKRSAASLQRGLQAASHVRKAYGSISSPAHYKWRWSAAAAVGFHSQTGDSISCGTTLPSSAAALAVLPGGMRSTFTLNERNSAVATQLAVHAVRCVGAVCTFITVTAERNGRSDRDRVGCDAERTATQRPRCRGRGKRKLLRAIASDAVRQLLFSHIHSGESRSGVPPHRTVSRGRRCRRDVLTGSGETLPAGKWATGGVTCTGGGSETKGTRISDFAGVKCIPVALGVAPLQQKGESSLSEKRKCGAVEGGREDSSSAPLECLEGADSLLCATEAAQVPLSDGKFLPVPTPCEDSYAAVLQQKIRAESAEWVADSDLVNCLTDFLLLFKTAVDAPWAVALPLLGATFRLTTLPFAISSERDIRLRAVYQEEMTALQRAAEKAKLNGFGSPEFKKAQKRLKTFLKKHNLSLIPLSIFQVLLVGLVVGLTTPAIRNISGRSNEFPHFAVEHPAWVESLALPDPTPLTAFVGTYGMLSLIMAGWLVSDKIAKTLPQQGPSSTPFLTRVIPGVVASCVTAYAGVSFPVGAMFMLLPAAGVQAVFTRMFRIRAIERIFNLVPESVKPLHAVYVDALRCRTPEVFQMWQRELQEKKSAPQEVHSRILLLWREKLHRDSWGTRRPNPYSVSSNGARL